MITSGSHILLCKNIELLKKHVIETYPSLNLRLFAPDDFLIEDAKAVVKEAYIAEKDEKIIAMVSRSYNIYAQNSLLKILEEPPRNITFILAVPSKLILLPTIRSRLPIKTVNFDEQKAQIDICFKKLDIKTVYEFVHKNKFLEKNELKKLLQDIMTQSLNEGIKLSHDELDIYAKLLHLAELNSRAGNLLLCALLTILNRRHK